MAETWISVTEAANKYGYHPERLRELIREKKIDARRYVTVWQIKQSSLEAYIRKVRRLGEKRGPRKK